MTEVLTAIAAPLATAVASATLIFVTLVLVRALKEAPSEGLYLVYRRGAQGPDGELRGVPFFLKRRRHLRKSVYHQPFATVKLEISSEFGGVLFSGERGLSWGSGSKAEKLRARIGTWGLEDMRAAEELIQTFLGAPSWIRAAEDLEVGTDVYHAGTGRASVVEVDYATPHYINARRSYLGSSEIDVELHADGTLSKSGSKADSKVISDIIQAASGIPSAKAAPEQPGEPPEQAGPEGVVSTGTGGGKRDPFPPGRLWSELSVDVRIREHTLEKGLEAVGDPASAESSQLAPELEPIPFDDMDATRSTKILKLECEPEE